MRKGTLLVTFTTLKRERASVQGSLQIKAHSTTEAHVITSNCTAERKSLKKKIKECTATVSA
jgi:hypothetical protein